MDKWEPKDRTPKKNGATAVLSRRANFRSTYFHTSTSPYLATSCAFCVSVSVPLSSPVSRRKMISTLRFSSLINIMPIANRMKIVREYFSCIRFCCFLFLFIYFCTREAQEGAFSFDTYSYLFDEDNERRDSIVEQQQKSYIFDAKQ